MGPVSDNGNERSSNNNITARDWLVIISDTAFHRRGDQTGHVVGASDGVTVYTLTGGKERRGRGGERKEGKKRKERKNVCGNNNKRGGRGDGDVDRNTKLWCSADNPARASLPHV